MATVIALKWVLASTIAGAAALRAFVESEIARKEGI